MTLAADFIADLDDEIADQGQTVALRAQGSPADGSADVLVRAVVRGFTPEELAGGVDQNDSKVILSPSSLAGTPFAAGIKRLAVMLIDGRARSIETLNAIRVDDQVVRIEARVLG